MVFNGFYVVFKTSQSVCMFPLRGFLLFILGFPLFVLAFRELKMQPLVVCMWFSVVYTWFPAVTYSVVYVSVHGFQWLRIRFSVVLHVVSSGYVLGCVLCCTWFSVVYTHESGCSHTVFNGLYLQIELFVHGFQWFTH
jgi:hypothetical protein